MTAPAAERAALLRLVPPPLSAVSEPGRLVVCRAPQLEPPYDDEVGGPRLRLVRVQPELPFDEDPPPRRFQQPLDFFDPQPTPRRALPEPESWATRYIRAVLEMLAGRRPAAQLQEWTSPLALGALTIAASRRCWTTPSGSPPTARSIRVSEPADGVAEISAVVQRGQRFFAIAGRLEGLDGRWRCVAIRVG